MQSHDRIINETDNGIGIAGVAWDASIGSLKVCYEDYFLKIFGIIQGYCDDADVASAILYAADAGYQVINMSLARPEFSITVQDAVNYALQEGAVLAAAAGNNYSPVRQYPAAYDNVIAVAATDYFDNLAYFSSFGKADGPWVSVVETGQTIAPESDPGRWLILNCTQGHDL